jgi:cobalt/nickel transport system permease protein
VKHSFLDLYREGDSIVHRLDPRVKCLATLAFVVSASLMPAGYWPGYLGLLLLLLAAVAAASVPLRVAFGRSLVAIPFALMAALSLPFIRPGAPLLTLAVGPWRLTATAAGLEALAEVLVRSWLSVLAAGLLTATTPFAGLLAGLQALGLPRVLAAVISFLYRYLFVLVDEGERLGRARESRSVRWPPGSMALTARLHRRQGPHSGGTVAWRARVLGGIIGSLFIRSYERSERVYQAMLARGFQGEIRSAGRQKITPVDVRAGLGFCLVLAALVASGRLSWWSG